MRRLTLQLHKVAALLCAFLLCAALCAPAVAADTPYSGSVGSIDWSVTAGILSLRGTGAIPDFTERNPAPWAVHKNVISRVSLSDGITRIGDMAFYEFKLIKSVSLPRSVQTVGEMAFAGCEGLTTVAMPGVTHIESYAFSRCKSLDGVVLPETLTTLDDHAFYWCSSLSYIRIPASVTHLGRTVFGYCTSLLRVDVDAPVAQLPEWFFYGCEDLRSVTLPPAMSGAGDDAFTRCDVLQYVYYTGNDENLGTLIDDITHSLPNFSIGNVSSTPDSQPPSMDYDNTVQGDELKATNTEVSTGDGLVVRVEQTVTYPIAGDGTTADPDEMDTTIHATITGDSGWNTLVDVVQKEELEHSTFEVDYGEQSPVDVQISLPHSNSVSGDWLSQMAGHNATVTITTPDGSRWSFDCEHLLGRDFEKNYDLSYSLERYANPSDAHRLVVGSSTCYWLTFSSAVSFPVTVEVLLDPLAARQNVTLYECLRNDTLTKLQAVMIDTDGFAFFTLGNVNSTIRYMLALNVSGTSSNDVLVPDSMMENPDDLKDLVPLDERYTLTEPRGLLGMTMSEFTTLVLTVVGVFVAIVLLVTLTIIILGKRKAKIAAIRAEVMGEKTPTDSEELK